MLKNLLLYLSAFMPMYVLVFVKLVVEIINNNLSFNVLNTINFATLLLLIIGGVIGLLWNVKYNNEKSNEIIILKSENITDKHFLGYFSLFVFFAIPLDLSLVSAYCVYVLVLIFIGIVYINNSLYYINPLLNILGYNFYDIEYRDVDSGEIKQGKIFFKGEPELGKPYFAKVKNPDLWRRYLEVSRSHTIHAHWIKGHSGIALNEECDKIAKSEAMKFLRSE